MLAEAGLADPDLRLETARVAAKVDAVFSYYLAGSGDDPGEGRRAIRLAGRLRVLQQHLAIPHDVVHRGAEVVAQPRRR